MADSGERGHGGLIAACACAASAYALLQSSWRRDAELAALRTAVAGDVGTVVRASAAALAEGQPAPLVVLHAYPAPSVPLVTNPRNSAEVGALVHVRTSDFNVGHGGELRVLRAPGGEGGDGGGGGNGVGAAAAAAAAEHRERAFCADALLLADGSGGELPVGVSGAQLGGGLALRRWLAVQLFLETDTGVASTRAGATDLVFEWLGSDSARGVLQERAVLVAAGRAVRQPPMLTAVGTLAPLPLRAGQQLPPTGELALAEQLGGREWWMPRARWLSQGELAELLTALAKQRRRRRLAAAAFGAVAAALLCRHAARWVLARRQRRRLSARRQAARERAAQAQAQVEGGSAAAEHEELGGGGGAVAGGAGVPSASAKGAAAEVGRQEQGRGRSGSRDRQLCVVCWDRPRETVFLDCGHSCCCERCAAVVRGMAAPHEAEDAAESGADPGGAGAEGGATAVQRAGEAAEQRRQRRLLAAGGGGGRRQGAAADEEEEEAAAGGRGGGRGSGSGSGSGSGLWSFVSGVLGMVAGGGAEAGGRGRCPICRQPITRVVRIYDN